MQHMFKAAVVQAAPVMFDRDATIEKVRALASRAASGGNRLVVFPEAFVSGYPKGLDFGARVGGRTPEGRVMFRRYFSSAVEVPGWATEDLGSIAHDNSIFLVIGVIERAGGTLYCTALFFDPQGNLMGKHRKLMPTAMERVVWGMGDGSTLPVFHTAIGKIGAVICWENYMPLLRTAMYAKGIELYCAPTVDDRETWARSMQHIAFEGRCFVLSAVQFLRRGDCPADYPAIQGDQPETVLIRGGSVIANPQGVAIAGPVYDTEEILSAEIHPEQIIEGKYDLDVVGHYARPDVFRLVVNECENRTMEHKREQTELL